MGGGGKAHEPLNALRAKVQVSSCYGFRDISVLTLNLILRIAQSGPFSYDQILSRPR